MIYCHNEMIYISDNTMGRGVYAKRKILAGELIEICPVIVMGENYLIEKERGIEDKRWVLSNYYFDWNSYAAICLGYGSLYNHSYNPNAMYVKVFENNVIRFVAISDIEQDSEIFVNYNGDPYCQDKIWFDAR